MHPTGAAGYYEAAVSARALVNVHEVFEDAARLFLSLNGGSGVSGPSIFANGFE